MSSTPTQRLLMVDDEPHVLAGFRRALGRMYDLTVAEGGRAGLAAIEAGPEFAVIVTDMRMPELNGIEFISRARAKSRDSIYIMLTGNADQQTAAEAVNKGQIFRFLSKPCGAGQLESAVSDAMRQFELVTAERVLLRETLTGSIRLMSDALELADPELYRSQSLVKNLMTELCKALGIDRDWQFAVAASLCLVGLVTVPRRDAGFEFSEEVLANVASTGGRLVGHIPRLKSVARMISQQREPGMLPENLASTEEQERERVGTQLLRYCVDLARAERQNEGRQAAIDALEKTGRFDPRLIAALRSRDASAVAAAPSGASDQAGAPGPTARTKGGDTPPGAFPPSVTRSAAAPVTSAETPAEPRRPAQEGYVVRSVQTASLSPGMVIDQDVSRNDGTLLLSAGQTLSELSTARLKNYALQRLAPTVVNVRVDGTRENGVAA